jgi:predicted nuclease of predicted toxin-antitoxin system
MKIKLDENLSRHLKGSLINLGHDVTTAAEENLLGQPDSQVAAAARIEGRMLFTLDVKFADIRQYPPGDHPGFVLFRPASFGPLAVNRFVEAFVRTTDLDQFVKCVVVVEPLQIRVRRPSTRE